ncbi:eukaryotic translation initiation factor 3 subunit C [Kluyveromyces marxianus]|uniref:Eukaryotic translation initiation factor 3 subunit C n=1 Tax=Kluyveromyces marxianus (strain DMKU3-1042 / BCC 29191 / NBRC 104275) TaxID=1003335 RepID=W0TFT2_KLUMD|nr:eukaryotic translation initiation factor 3 subunit C [Kluyveromyces marxianus DMKU3-1042]BAO42497.1 eukaryotic translation initiation factor 3 subunit C [Kluyveromyces marxianus DMKU3-1042]BAP73885.1 eukaryotic translation initiation factor 3 subunit C [Kluyveromyces marxianus]
MSRFFLKTYEYDSTSSGEEEDLLSQSEEDLLSSSSDEELSDDSFFNDSSDSSDNDEDNDSDSKPYGPDWFKKPEFRKGGASGVNKFLKSTNYSSDEDSSDEEDGKKVVKSAKEKLLDEMKSIYQKIDGAEAQQDWESLLNYLESVLKLYTRAQQQNYGTPNIYVKTLARFEDAVSATSQDEIKNKAVARAYNTTRQRVKKLVRENEESLKAYRESPESFDKEPVLNNEADSREVSATPFSLSTNKKLDLASMASNISEMDFFKTLNIIIDSRGKKNTDHQAQIRTTEELLKVASTPYEKICTYLNLIPIRFDASVSLSYQPLDQWKASKENLDGLLDLLEKEVDHYQVTEFAPRNDFIEDEPEANENGVKEILGSIFSMVERLDDEFTKSLLNIDTRSSEYMERLKDEQSMYNLIIRAQLYFERVTPEEHRDRVLSRVFIRRLEHIYYKSSKLISIMETVAWKHIRDNTSASESSFIFLKESDVANEDYTFNVISELSDLLIKQKSNNFTGYQKGTLYKTYYIGLNKDYEEAKKLMLSSDITKSISGSDASLQILYNRCVIQLGLAAFKAGLINECHQVLNGLCINPHLREILGQQSLQRASANSNVVQGAPVEQLCIPFHQHINLDLIDTVYMTCSLLLDVPHMAAYYSGIKVQRIPVFQKSIRRILESSEKAIFHGPPETLRDHILYAAKSMQKGDYLQSIEYLRKISVWSLLSKTDDIINQLSEKVQIETLKTYIFTYKRFYTKISISKLSKLFDLDVEKVLEVAQSIINDYEVKAKLDENNEYIVFERGEEITKLEEVAIKLVKETKYHSERLRQ